MMPKKTSGRQKIAMKKIEKKSSRQVTFTKRRGGLFKKAAELCVLTGAEVAIIVQSPGNHVYAFGHRDVDSIIETYLGNNVSLLSENPNPRPMHGEEYNDYLKTLNHELEVEKSKSNNVVEESRGFWWENSFEDMEMDELEVFIKSMEELKNNMRNKADESRNLVASSSMINTNGGADESRNLVASSSLIGGADESRNLVASSSLIGGADESRNLVASSSFDTNTNFNNVDGLLDDQAMVPNLDQFLLNNITTDEELMSMMAFNDNSGGFNNNYYSFGNGELALENHDLLIHGGNNFGVPNDNNFGQGQI